MVANNYTIVTQNNQSQYPTLYQTQSEDTPQKSSVGSEYIWEHKSRKQGLNPAARYFGKRGAIAYKKPLLLSSQKAGSEISQRPSQNCHSKPKSGALEVSALKKRSAIAAYQLDVSSRIHTVRRDDNALRQASATNKLKPSKRSTTGGLTHQSHVIQLHRPRRITNSGQ